MAESQTSEDYSRPRGMGRRVSVVLAAVVVAGAAAFGIQRVRAERANTEMASACVDRYNAMVGQAKSDLVRGDRIGAINSLTAARAQLHQCEVPSGISVSGIWH
jgi:hypothetical protein